MSRTTGTQLEPSPWKGKENTSSPLSSCQWAAGGQPVQWYTRASLLQGRHRPSKPKMLKPSYYMNMCELLHGKSITLARCLPHRSMQELYKRYQHFSIPVDCNLQISCITATGLSLVNLMVVVISIGVQVHIQTLKGHTNLVYRLGALI